MNSDMQVKSAQTTPKSVFFALLVVIFFCSVLAADSVGFVPCNIDDTCDQPNSVALSSLPVLGVTDTATSTTALPPVVSGVEPVRIEIPSVGIDLPVQNPSTTDVATLDALLNQGPARYVQSAELGTNGNMIIFAHSSHLPIVNNQMFRAFNQIPDLNAGDSITLVGDNGTSYLYSVVSVVKVDTEDGTQIPLTGTGTELTLVTCDTLTGVSSRFVLTAKYVGTI